VGWATALFIIVLLTDAILILAEAACKGARTRL